MKTLSEREDERLLYGQEYHSYPENTEEGDGEAEVNIEWKRSQRESHAVHGFKTLSAKQRLGQPEEVPYKPQGKASVTPGASSSLNSKMVFSFTIKREKKNWKLGRESKNLTKTGFLLN